MSAFVSVQPPPRGTLSSYDRSLPYDQQSSSSIPEVFLDAMSVRHSVYVEEQSVPLANEVDADDAQSYHWVVYASVGTPAGEDPDGGAAGRKSSSAARLPVGTVRLVLPPHVHHEDGNEHPDMSGAGEGQDAEKLGCLRRGNEPYVRMGRLAVLKPYRKMGLSSLLVNAAFEYAGAHADEVMPPVPATETEQRRLDAEHAMGPAGDGEWDGLVLVHAQRDIERLWVAWGFVKDQTMGEWDEEGIMHIGMWRRIKLDRRRQSIIGPSPGEKWEK